MMRHAHVVLAALGVFGLAGIGLDSAVTQRPETAAGNPQFEQLVDRYLKDVRGVGGEPAAADMSATRFMAQIDTERALLQDLTAIDRKTLTFDQDIDYRFLQSLLKS